MIKPLLLLFALIFVSNSAISQPEPKQTKTDPESTAQTENAPQSENAVQYGTVEKYEDADIVCTKERKTGTRIYTKICRTKAQIEADRASGADYIQRLKSTPQASSGDNG